MKNFSEKIGSGVVGLVLAASVWAAGSGAANAYVIDMEGIVSFGGITTESAGRVWGDFTLAPVHGHYVDSQHGNILNGSWANNGTDWFIHDTANPLTLFRNDAQAFALNSIDATFWNVGNNGTATSNDIVVTGAIFGGGIVTTTLTIDDNASFQTFMFDSSWSNLAGVSFQNTNSAMGYDNITVNQAVESVPEPGAIAILGLGLLGLAGLRRRG